MLPSYLLKLAFLWGLAQAAPARHGHRSVHHRWGSVGKRSSLFFPDDSSTQDPLLETLETLPQSTKIESPGSLLPSAPLVDQTSSLQQSLQDSSLIQTKNDQFAGHPTQESPPIQTHTGQPPQAKHSDLTTPSPSLQQSNPQDTSAATNWGLSAKQQETIVTMHNDYRKRHGADSLAWDKSLANFAAQQAGLCKFEHASNNAYGENLAQGYQTIAKAMDAWYQEIQSYDFNNPGFGESTGHATQMLWIGTTLIGCALNPCGTLRDLVICEVLESRIPRRTNVLVLARRKHRLSW
ncbi:Protein PRY2 [Neolecta irregularis DAH-3]|uniref:Protein PRY2 n=1 Tax=Neolecta irregularis (strain DAH-3) TaxID=1198029 RepID=A0A1U7LVU0_NEOID|nr:Protein PRY2 [Neolecta irregularis DAH-3]|eukprot:OLL26738.1 Protein PRY2 [Neolecta irregularis DAH-3]